MLKQINNEIVRPIRMIGGAESRRVRGADLFAELYANIFICARKNSGKTSVINTVIQKCCGRDTKILAFVSTINKDSNWLAIKAACARKRIYFEGHTSIIDNGVDQLDLFVKGEENPEEEENEDCSSVIDAGDRATSTQRETSYVAPEWLIILDDLSTEL